MVTVEAINILLNPVSHFGRVQPQRLTELEDLNVTLETVATATSPRRLKSGMDKGTDKRSNNCRDRADRGRDYLVTQSEREHHRIEGKWITLRRPKLS
jgi:hypothetical protein